MRTPRLTGKDEVRSHAIAILDHVARHVGTHYQDLVVSSSAIYRRLASRFDDPNDLDEPLRFLERFGWVVPVSSPPTHGPGRPRSPSYRFHPHIREWS